MALADNGNLKNGGMVYSQEEEHKSTGVPKKDLPLKSLKHHL
jgi:hypothetical protein